jgi:hypothetical protein
MAALPMPARAATASMVTTWIVACALVLEPSGFLLGLVPAGLLVAAEVVRRRT